MSDLLHDPALWFVVFASMIVLAIVTATRTNQRLARRDEEERRQRALRRLNLPEVQSVSRERNDTIEEVTNTAVTKTAVNPINPAASEATTPMKISDFAGSRSGSDES